ncbi:GNAT family N-acetyltransferase [Rhizobium tubonense]|uniref:GNAT family N-acetyltransferase n=2 Tax=Rhizobium tubonense TaxID=484088 RepID=A0A2W4CHH3_9HYPH|nr:GNAT family N-acetyltransferase [Rhizobium tubonense]
MSLSIGLWTIRRARAEEMPTLADIYLTVRRTTFTWVDPGRFHREDFSTHTKDETLFVCHNEDCGIAGFLALWEPENFIHMLYIRPEFQGQGAGTALLNALPNWPRRRYRLKCLVKNKRALAYYEAMGFEVSGFGASPEGDYKDMELVTTAGRIR